LAVGLLVIVAACGTPEGAAIQVGDSEQSGLVTLRTGAELGIDFTFLTNIADHPITIIAIKPVGRGLGTVIRPVETKIAIHKRSLPRAAYIEDPPVLNYGNGKCGVQRLGRVSGFVLRRGVRHAISTWMVLLGVHPGRYNVHGVIITYVQDGHRVQQMFPHGFAGRVKADAPLLRATEDGSKPCLHLTHLLKGALP
jgi:hypothetical protein